MKLLLFSTIAPWKVGKEKIADILAWCDIHCEGKVERPYQHTAGEAFAFELESDFLLFTLYWR